MEESTELKLINMSDVQTQEIKWLWYPFIAYGKMSIVQGDGKSTLVLNIAAKLSRGERFEPEMNNDKPVNVIYQTAEDGLADTVKPRLMVRLRLLVGCISIIFQRNTTRL